jgi:hypothetical protein
MTDVFPKFIVEGNNLVIGKCTYHKQMASDIKQVKGGGMWEWDKESKTFFLYGDSTDFGYASPEDIQACLQAGNAFLSYIGGRSIADHKFYLNTGSEIIKLNESNQQP